jgi:hypothetical protein
MQMPDDHYGDVRVGQVMIFGDSLKEFHYAGSLFGDYCLYNSFSLKKAVIDAYAEVISDQFAYRTYKLLIGLSNVKFLKLYARVLEVCVLLSL